MTMQALRDFLLRHRALAIAMVMAALCMKIALPNGIMLGQDAKVLSVRICEDAIGGQAAKQIVIPMKNGAGEANGKPGGKGADSECAFTSLSMASISNADAALLALALAFILALGFAPVRPANLKRVFHLRPPLRGPPALV